MHGGAFEAKRVLQLDQAHSLLPAVAEAGEDADGTIDALDAHQVTFRLSSSRLIFEVCDSPVCGSSSRDPDRRDDRAQADHLLEPPFQILLHGDTVLRQASGTSVITVSSSRPLSPKRSITQKNSPLVRPSSATVMPIASVKTFTPRTFTMLSLRP